MASLSTEKDRSGKKTLRRIVFNSPEGKQKTLRLGPISLAVAREIFIKVKELISCDFAQCSWSDETANWVRQLDPGLRKKLVTVGLLAKRLEQEERRAETLLAFTSRYIAGRAKLKPSTVANLERSRIANLTQETINMLAPTNTWTCDVCQQAIMKPADGVVAWFTPDNADEQGSPGHDIRIIHNFGASPFEAVHRCYFRSVVELQREQANLADDTLDRFQGPDGFMRLFEMLATKELPETELIEIIKRIHVPLYEAARLLMANALKEGTIEGSVAPGFWTQQQMQTVLEERVSTV